MKKKLLYISTEGFFDVDFPILQALNLKYDLIWIPILRPNSWYSEEEISTFCESNSIQYVPLIQKYKYKDPRIFIFYFKLLKVIRRIGADVVYFEYFGVPVFHFLSPFFLELKKTVIAIHDVEQHYKMEYGSLKTWYFNYLLKKFENFQVFSENQFALFKERYPSKKVFSADLYLKDFGKANVQKAQDGKIHFLFFGIIRKNKGLDLIIRAFNEIAKKRNDFLITIAGDGRDWDEYERLIECRENYKLIIRKIKNSEIPDLFSQSHYLLVPYRDVTQSGVLLTAYNYGLPAIASDLPGFREYIIDGYNGFLVEPNNVSSLQLQIENVIAKQHCYSQIESNLKSFIEDKIQLETIVDRYKFFFDSLISNN